MLFNFLSNLHIPLWFGKTFECMMFRLVEKVFARQNKESRHFYSCPLSENPGSYHSEITYPPTCIFSKIIPVPHPPTSSRNGWRDCRLTILSGCLIRGWLVGGRGAYWKLQNQYFCEKKVGWGVGHGGQVIFWVEGVIPPVPSIRGKSWFWGKHWF